MTIENKNFTLNPTKKTLILFTLIWVIGTGLIIYAISDSFGESFFQKKYGLLYLMLIGSTFTVAKLYYNYFKNKN
jgi:hypothetical protein